MLCLGVGVRAQTTQTEYSTPPVLFRSVPAYPPIAHSANATGTVNVDVMVTQDGTVTTAKSMDGHPLLRRAAEVSARGWQFVASTDAIPRLVRLTFTFKISSTQNETDVEATFITPYHVEISRAPTVISDPPAILTRRKHRTKRRHRLKLTQSNKSLARFNSL